MAKRRSESDLLTADQRIARAFADLERATQLAFDAKGVEVDATGEEFEFDKPDLQSLARLIELAFKANGVLTADGKGAKPGDAPVSVQVDELERLLKAVKAKSKENLDVKES